eukprot:6088153-Heterocapsa_arctica.AAC.1
MTRPSTGKPWPLRADVRKISVSPPSSNSGSGSGHDLVGLEGHRGLLAARQDVDGPQLLEDGLVLQRRVGPRELHARGHGGLAHLR